MTYQKWAGFGQNPRRRPCFQNDLTVIMNHMHFFW
jgi:hypothetical protein